jgi:hypothetical protein
MQNHRQKLEKLKIEDKILKEEMEEFILQNRQHRIKLKY